MKKALITGITGQDGSYLAELLLSKDYEVHGIIRRSSTFNTGRLDNIYVDPHEPTAKLFLHYGDLCDCEQISNLVYNLAVDEIYNLGAQSHVRVSFDCPEYTTNVDALGTTRILEAIRRSGSGTKFYQASSSEMFGASPSPQNEDTPFKPRSPYSCSKLYSYWMTRNYREGYGLFTSNGILFNHESQRRGETFVTRKITMAIANILKGTQDKLFLGNLDAKRDWGYAPEYVEGIWRILQLDEPDDFVLGMGENHSVKDFVQAAFEYVDLDWKKFVEIDHRYLRPTEVVDLRADCSKAKRVFGWNPKITFEKMVWIMVDADMQAMELKPIGRGKHLLDKNFDWHIEG